MNTFLKRFLKIILTFIIIAFLSMLAIFTFVDPNQFKGTIEKQVLDQTGHVLKIQGPLSWHFTPMLSLGLQNISLNDPAGTQNLLTAKNIETDLNLGSLFLGKIFLNLKLDGLQLFLTQYKNGTHNWENLFNRFSNVNKEQNKKSSFSIMVSGIQVNQGMVVINDLKKTQTYKIENIGLSAENLMQAAIGISKPIALNLELVKNNEALGTLSFKCEWALKYLEHKLIINHAHLNFTTRAGVETALTGNALIENLDRNPKAMGKLQGKNINLDAVLKELNLAEINLPEIQNIQTDFEYLNHAINITNLNTTLKNGATWLSNLSLDLNQLTPKTLDLKGNFLGKNLVFNNIKIDEIKGNLITKNGNINISPITLFMAQSTQELNLNIDLNHAEPKYTLIQEGKGFEIKHWLAMFNVQNKLEGKTNLKLKLSASGNSKETIFRTLTGETSLEILNGKFYGADLIALLKSTQSELYDVLTAITKKQKFNLNSTLAFAQNIWEKKPSENAYTPFNSLKATTTINNGIINNPDFNITHSEYTLKGHGSLNLNSGTIQYQNSVLLNKNPYPSNDDIGNYLYNNPLPVKIEGAIKKPDIKPDIKAYTNNAIRYAEQKLAKDLVQKTINQGIEKVIKKNVTNGNPELEDNINKAVNGLLQQLGQ